ncbi:MAG: hypothetical protein GF417_04225, partial [Candidatus Latescibacteria bacterium]|nr:hypothetical protein [bacterium]MBD3423633.1 hypothetical protein [Candidatus Latescibacterota bacterium]
MKRFELERKWIALTAVALILAAGFLLGRYSSGRAELSTPVQAQVMDVENEELPDVIEKAIPAVVNISSKRVVRNSLASDPYFRDFFRRFFRNIPQERVQRNLGSGVIVSSDGYILTSNHLVNQAEEIEVTLPDKRKFDAEVIGTDSESDVAVIKIEGEDLPILPTGNSDQLRLGETV